MEELRTRLDGTERRLQEANEILQAQIAERKRAEETFEKVQKYAESIMETIREPLLVLASDLRVLSANRSFYNTFKVTPNETVGNLIYNLGNQQWETLMYKKHIHLFAFQSADGIPAWWE